MEYRPNDGNKTDIENKPGIMELVSGILRDATDIISKEMMAARLEMREELDKAKSSAVMLGVAAGLPQALFLRQGRSTPRPAGRPTAVAQPSPSHAA